MDENDPEQEALFQIEGPDEDGCVWGRPSTSSERKREIR